MEADPRDVIILAGPNGAGKSTAAPVLLKGTLGLAEFVNMDVIAEGLSAFEPDRVAMAAGRIMLARLRELAGRGVSFAFETTLASRSFARWIAQLTAKEYRFRLLFLWLPTPEFAVQRVADRVRMGGHDVPDETIRRRYHKGLSNFFELYRPLASTWRMYDNSGQGDPRLIAAGSGNATTLVADKNLWERIEGGSLT